MSSEAIIIQEIVNSLCERMKEIVQGDERHLHERLAIVEEKLKELQRPKD